MAVPRESPFDIAYSPLRQALVVVVAIPTMIVLFWLPSKVGLFELESYFPWTVAAALTLLFGIGNSVLSLSAKDQNQYWGRSIMAFFVVVLAGIGIAWLFTGQSIYEVKSFRWLYVVFTFCYLLFLSMVRAMRKIVSIAQKQDARLRGERE
ncbi:MAG: hypothetical protein AAFQ02_06065 [Bacteroidota bacterium]